jgi:hypothetical protein
MIKHAPPLQFSVQPIPPFRLDLTVSDSGRRRAPAVGRPEKYARRLGRSRPLDYAGVGRAVARSPPYAGLVYFHLLLDGLSQTGALESPSATCIEGVHH